MDSYKFPLALFAFFGFVAVLPAWYYYLDTYGPDLPAEAFFLATLLLPATVSLFLASWIQPRG